MLTTANVLTHKPCRLAVNHTCRNRHLSVVVYAKDGPRHTGIHDPAGPTGSWGAGTHKSQQEGKAKEERFAMERDQLSKQEHRSQNQTHFHPAHLKSERDALRDAILKHAEKEMGGAANDAEYARMSKADKLKMILKDKLYAWLGTGAEPL